MSNKKNIPYIVFSVSVLLIMFLFFNSQSAFGDSRKLKDDNYNLTIQTVSGSYYYKIANARIDKSTNTLYADFYIKEGKAEKPKEYPPTVYDVTAGDKSADHLSFSVEPNSSKPYANTLTIRNIPQKFYYLRLYVQIKGYDTPVPDSVDEFGNIIKHEAVPGKTNQVWVYIDYRNVFYYDSTKGENPPEVKTVDLSKVDKVMTEQTTAAPVTEVTTPPATTTVPPQTSAPVTTITPQNTYYPSPQGTTRTPSVTSPPYAPVTTKPHYVTTAPNTTTRPKVTTTVKPVVTTKAPVVTTPPTPTIPVLINTISLAHYINITLKAGQTFKAVPKIYPTNATNKTLTWVSASPLVATVGSDGTITARGSGKAIITCWTTDGTNLSASCMVTVG